MLTSDELGRMQEIQIKDVDKSALADIESITLDAAIPIAERLETYLRQVKNPYLFRCGDTAIKLDYSCAGGTIDDALSVYLSHLKNP